MDEEQHKYEIVFRSIYNFATLFKDFINDVEQESNQDPDKYYFQFNGSTISLVINDLYISSHVEFFYTDDNFSTILLEFSKLKQLLYLIEIDKTLSIYEKITSEKYKFSIELDDHLDFLVEPKLPEPTLLVSMNEFYNILNIFGVGVGDVCFNLTADGIFFVNNFLLVDYRLFDKRCGPRADPIKITLNSKQIGKLIKFLEVLKKFETVSLIMTNDLPFTVIVGNYKIFLPPTE